MGSVRAAARRLRDPGAASGRRACLRGAGRRAEVSTPTAVEQRSMRFTLRQLEYFIATCEAGSVTEAALTIPVAQSSVSAAVAQLERALGVQLLIRHHAQGVSMTPAGREFLLRARALIRDVEQLERFADELIEGLSGTLDLGCLVTVAPLVMPQLCSPFLRAHPEARIEMTEAGQSEIVERLRTGKLSVALSYDLELSPDLGFDPLAEL